MGGRKDMAGRYSAMADARERMRQKEGERERERERKRGGKNEKRRGEEPRLKSRERIMRRGIKERTESLVPPPHYRYCTLPPSTPPGCIFIPCHCATL